MSDAFAAAAKGIMAGLWTLCLAVLAATSAHASDRTRMVDLGTASCEFAAASGLRLGAALARATPEACFSERHADGRSRWLVRTGLDIVSSAERPATIHIKQTLFDRLTAHVVFADGRRFRAVHDRTTAANNIELGGIVCLHVPASASPIVAVALHAEGVGDVRGAFVRPSLSSGSGGESSHRGGHGLLYGVFAGVVLATLAFNLVLFHWLRYSFLGFYCGMVVATILYGVATSGILHWFGLRLSPGMSVVVGEFSMGIIAWFAVLFTLTLFERGMVPRRLGLAAVLIASATALAGSAALVAALAAPTLVPPALTALNALGGAMLLLVVPICVCAALRGSRIVYLYVLAWALPIAGGATRTLTGLGLVETTPLIEDSHFYALCVEAIVSMFGIAYRIASLRDERDSAEARASEMAQLAETDALTGLLNRRGFIRAVVPSADVRKLVLVDIDHFKTINDGFGHATGDLVLRAVAQLIERLAPPGSVVGRLGGEEFAVMLPDTDPASAMLLVSAFRGTPMPEGIRLTVSAGAATGVCANDADWRHLYRRADAALYRAKADGRDRLEIDAPSGRQVAA
jgi:diguanylate cyclase (GGDEF)-like protein